MKPASILPYDQRDYWPRREVDKARLDLDHVTYEAMKDILALPEDQQQAAAEGLAEAILEDIQGRNKALQKLRRRYRLALRVAARWQAR